MDFGIGVDIEDTRRFSRLSLKRHHAFLQKIFTKKELEYCFARTDHGPHLAARFCAKEAVIKALSSVGVIRVPYGEIEIINNRHGVPEVKIARGRRSIVVKLSISHMTDTAIAFAVVMSREIYAGE